MTVHASKGLEFPIVFVVNMAKGASGPPKPIRVIANGDEEPSVSIGPFVSDQDETDRAREKHETRRLLYVAFTRARDRLYLASGLKAGVLAPGRGSLAEVLPESLRALFARAATAFPEYRTVAWVGTSGQTFEFRLCRPDPDGAQVEMPSEPAKMTGQRPEGQRDLPGPAVCAPVEDCRVRVDRRRWLGHRGGGVSTSRGPARPSPPSVRAMPESLGWWQTGFR